MKILNFGSLNLDYVYRVPRFLAPGETMAAKSVEVVPGGKGLNQSIALARAGAEVFHAGVVGAGSDMLTELLCQNKVDLSYLKHSENIQGNAIIQVAPSGENAILLCGGSNREITAEQVKETLESFGEGDWLILQNEVSCLKEMVKEAGARGMNIVLNPSSIENQLLELDFHQISWLFINEIEGCQMTGAEEPEMILEILRTRYPKLNVVLTLGKDGAICDTPNERMTQPAFKIGAVDTTAAGDTFTGYFIACYTQGETLDVCMKKATAAAAISVSRAGASVSIPMKVEVEEFLENMSVL